MTDNNSPLWDAELYDKNSQFQFTLGLKAIEMLQPKEGENILDIGCGNAMTTIEIAKLVPSGKITAIELSEQMIDKAQINLKEHNIKNVRIWHENALNIDFMNEFDAIFSNSAIHWITDLEKMYGLLYNALKSGGRLIVQTGMKEINTMFKALKMLENDNKYQYYFKSMEFPWRFLTKNETESILKNCEFSSIRVEPKEMLMEFNDRISLSNYFRAAALVPYLNLLPPHLYEEFVKESIDTFIKINGKDRFKVKFTRLYISAKKP